MDLHLVTERVSMKTVLIIDDSENMRMTIRELLMQNGYQIVGEAADGAEGVEKYKELNPDIVTMDVIMREMNGIEALRQIVKYDSKAKVVMISAMGQDIFVKDAIVSGAKGFIVKPFGEQQLMETFRKL